jgi:glycosyltransferase involved in cell wall biosynthesis
MIFGAMRVKNETRWIARVIKSLQPICERIVVLDDGSTDNTTEIVSSLGCVWYPQYPAKDEPSAKDALLAYLWERGAQIGDYVLWCDGDEQLVQEDLGNLEAAIEAEMEAAAFRIVYLWNDEKTVRVDGIYGSFNRPSMFRLTSRELSFLRTQHGGGFHCSNVPQQLINKAVPIPVRLLHYGYLDREERKRKFKWYNAKEWNPSWTPEQISCLVRAKSVQDYVYAFGCCDKLPPGLRMEDGYRHMIIGDHFHADSRFLHAGPLKLVPLSELRNNCRWTPRIEGHYDARNRKFDPPEMAEVLQYHNVLLDGQPVRVPWYFDTKEGIVKSYFQQPDYRCRACGKGAYQGSDNDWWHDDDQDTRLCTGALIGVNEHERFLGPIIVSEDSWTLRGKVEIVRK